MKKFIILISFLLPAFAGFCQVISKKLVYKQGQVIDITMDVKSKISQEAMGNAIDFTIDGSALHFYKVTNSTDDNSTLHHGVKRITFNFDGMGQKRSFDSDNKKDLDGSFGAPVKDILSKEYDMVIDTTGKALMVKPEKIELAKVDDRLSIVLNMLKDITAVVTPPEKNQPSFFKILPDKEIKLNEEWAETLEDANGKFNAAYTLSSITDSTIVVDFKGTSVTLTKGEIMGMQTSTTLNNSFTGKIIIDRVTGLMREKTMITDSNGSTEAMGGNMPVTSKTTVTIFVKPQMQ